VAALGGLKKQQSIKINFDTLPDKKKSDENHSFFCPATT
jgi:hypothetical protein